MVYDNASTTLSTKGDTSAEAGTTLTVAPSGGSADYHRTDILGCWTGD